MIYCKTCGHSEELHEFEEDNQYCLSLPNNFYKTIYIEHCKCSNFIPVILDVELD
jgi:hypothetical protein